MTTTDRQTITLPVTVAGETREITITPYLSDPDRAFTGAIFAARIGAGTKVHRTGTVAYRRDGEWKVGLSTCVRNRQAQIIGWADTYEGTSAATAQSYYGSI